MSWQRFTFNEVNDWALRVINASLASVQFEAETASFTCTINLAPGEMAKLKISAYVYAHELKVHYENVAQFSVPSKGEIILQDSIGKKNAWKK